MVFIFNFAEKAVTGCKTQLFWLLLLTFLDSVLTVLNEIMAVLKKTVCYMRVFQMTLDLNNRSSLNRSFVDVSLSLFIVLTRDTVHVYDFL